MEKRAQSQMMWIIISAVLAILVLVIYSYLTGGIVNKVASSVFKIHEQSDEELNCTVLPWTRGDNDGDGIRDVPACERFKRTR